ncbi:MAG: FkbM family methyltransferase [Deltaproteobacteria bacterium]|nr:FkbM family methyltransferase [Deltaproteobacteria bacterium]MCL4874406.1 FkbM family methyltransferase [bacterium]
MPHFDLRHFLETLGQRLGSRAFVVQVGAMDGRTFDPVHEFIKRFGWGGLLIEPVREHFEKLKETYRENPGIAFSNVAVAGHCGTIELFRVPSEHVAEGRVPRWGLGAASVYADRNALSFPEIRPFVVKEEVPCMTLPEILKQHGVSKIDILQIDTEGFDYQVLKQLDFSAFHPRVINMEIVNIPKSERTPCKRLLDLHGYTYVKAGYDLLAISLEDFVKQEESRKS